MKVPYRLETSFTPQECCDRLLHAFGNQATVRIAPGWLHAPHVVLGGVSVEKIKLHRGDVLENTSTPILTASVVARDTGSSIIGSFERGAMNVVFYWLVGIMLSMLYLGASAMVVFGMSDPHGKLPLGIVSIPIILSILWVGTLLLLGKWMRIRANETAFIRNFVEQALAQGILTIS